PSTAATTRAPPRARASARPQRRPLRVGGGGMYSWSSSGGARATSLPVTSPPPAPAPPPSPTPAPVEPGLEHDRGRHLVHHPAPGRAPQALAAQRPLRGGGGEALVEGLHGHGDDLSQGLHLLRDPPGRGTRGPAEGQREADHHPVRTQLR